MNAMRWLFVATVVTAWSGCKSMQPDPSPVVVKCECEAGCVSACSKTSQNTSYRTVEREPDPEPVPEPEPETVFEPVDAVAYPRLDGDDATAAAARVDASGDVVAVFKGDFARSRGEEVVIVTADRIDVYSATGSRIARSELGEVLAEREILAVRLVDSRAEVVLHHRVDGADFISVFRVIGSAVGRVFTTPTTSEVSFVHHGDERAIQVRTSASNDVFRWNHWEGMFRVPARAPTAPLRPQR